MVLEATENLMLAFYKYKKLIECMKVSKCQKFGDLILKTNISGSLHRIEAGKA